MTRAPQGNMWHGRPGVTCHTQMIIIIIYMSIISIIVIIIIIVIVPRSHLESS